VTGACPQRARELFPQRESVSRARSWALALALVIVTFVAYAPVWHAGFVWDDDAHVTQNLTLRSVDGLRQIWFEPQASQQYYPLQLTSYWIEYHLWGLQPLGYHLVNVLLHALNAVLLWRVLQRLGISGAWLAAAIFAVHPVEVESVAWVSERKNVLSGAFYLLAMLAYFRFRPLTGAGKTDSPDWRFYPLVIVLSLGALLSKTVTCSLPAVIILLTWWKNGRVEKRDIWVLTPLFILGAGLGLATAWLEKHHAGAAGADWSLSILQRCLLAGRTLWFYVGKLVWPHQFTFIYPRWEIDASVWWQYLFSFAAVVVLVALWVLRRRIGEGPLVAALAFGGALLPALGFVDVFPFRYSYVADHFQYLAGVGVIVLIATAGARLCARTGQPGKIIATAGAPILILALGTLTWKQACVYRDSESLWQDTIAKNPNAWVAHDNLGSALMQSGKLDEAIHHYEQALRLKPDYAEAHYALGIALMLAGRVPEAIAYYEQALRLDPDYAEAHNNLGVVLKDRGKVPEAIMHYEQALRLNPDYAEAHNNLGVVLEDQGKVPEAITHYEQALRIKPDYADAHYNLGTALARVGRLQDAVEHYEQAVRIKPDKAEAHNNLGNALRDVGRVQDAVGHFEQALQIKPDYAEAHYNLALAFRQVGKLDEAIHHYEQALRLKPDYAEAHNNLGNVLLQAGKREEAIGHYEQALRLKPDYVAAKDNLARARAVQ
jgi:tetratricopeptide (TPR) repeat protein